MKYAIIQSLFNAIEYYYDANYYASDNDLKIFAFGFHSMSSNSELSKKDLMRAFFFLEKWQKTQARIECVNMAVEDLNRYFKN